MVFSLVVVDDAGGAVYECYKLADVLEVEASP